ncbi:hypothetical protein D5S18_23155 [Nocardia panacis]|uniref:Uncharacterized protein n=1 Tax=Nocardia panacis TaxID=2340916 RepID=A0A3A4KGV8_9NOCA|nr:hypothetical protein [Nocardia panacis]RJO72080.1 hypothetical protein D5S18_23155 [Nocardia panacis]
MSGLSEHAEFDTEAGTLRTVIDPTPDAPARLGGVFDDLDGHLVVFYRAHSGLFLSVDSHTVDLEDGARTEWYSCDRASSYFAVTQHNSIRFAATYRNRLPDRDIGRFIDEVLANPARRARLFLPRN